MVKDDSAEDVSLRCSESNDDTTEHVNPPQYQTPQKSIKQYPSSSSLKKARSKQVSTPKTPSRIPTVTPYETSHADSSNRIVDERLLQQGLLRKMATNSTITEANTPNGGKSKDEHVRNGIVAPIPPSVPSHVKIIYLIRHGESLGQRATRAVRCSDPTLRDCGLSRLGQEQAHQLRRYFTEGDGPKIQLVLCSPLTRAIQTACLAFGNTLQDGEVAFRNLPPTKIMIHYHLREMGSNIPENQPRTMKQVKRDLVAQGGIDESIWEQQIDTLSLEPPPRSDWSAKKHLVSPGSDVHSAWPYQNSEHAPHVLRRDYVQYALHWLAAVRPESCVAVVCHYHVIRSALTGPLSPNRKGKGCDMDVKNATPIKCHLCTLTGQLTLAPS